MPLANEYWLLVLDSEGCVGNSERGKGEGKDTNPRLYIQVWIFIIVSYLPPAVLRGFSDKFTRRWEQ